MAEENSLFERLGGDDAITATVGMFYERIMADASLSPFFADLDMDKQINKQIAFMTMAFAGPNNYTGKDMREGHKHLISKGLNDTHVDIVIEHLGATLAEMGAAKDDIGEVAALAESVRNDVLCR